MHVSAKAVQLSDGYVGPPFPYGCQEGPELRPAVQRIRARLGRLRGAVRPRSMAGLVPSSGPFTGPLPMPEMGDGRTE
jgi:hypothetical protein